ncbi:5-formyltetrahydrofolate cyclo-ligase [Prosthecobacter fusiformis]|uniref:5-formyltetrahydrofolate cyclo-ligase n=2 Tax=Prosthecobacter fusiformis TaxID=48464 RepID=A0A4R7SRU7_9BACT|nr:5-formyltetrahydrofolate cyclo-ligase [Prosthecobacter fusiformis]
MSDHLPSKADLRRHVRERLRNVPVETLALWSRQLVAHLQEREDLWAIPGTVALFGGLRNEPDLMTDLLPWLQARGWRTALFAVQGVELMPFEVTGTHDLHRGPLGIWEPVMHPDRRLQPSELTLILVPGLAYSFVNGARLGRGGGYYDRLLSRPDLKAQLVGICFEEQIFPAIPIEAHDFYVPQIITEKALWIVKTSDQ